MIDLHGRICCTANVAVVYLNACTATTLLTLSERSVVHLHSHITSGNRAAHAHMRLLVSDDVRQQIEGVQLARGQISKAQRKTIIESNYTQHLLVLICECILKEKVMPARSLAVRWSCD